MNNAPPVTKIRVVKAWVEPKPLVSNNARFAPKNRGNHRKSEGLIPKDA